MNELAERALSACDRFLEEAERIRREKREIPVSHIRLALEALTEHLTAFSYQGSKSGAGREALSNPLAEQIALKLLPFAQEAREIVAAWVVADGRASLDEDLLAVIEQVAFSALQRAALATLEARQWQPIETAPKDRIFDAWLGDAEEQDVEFYCTPGTRRSPAWIWSAGRNKFVPVGGLDVPVFVHPTHWMPLPAPPQEKPE